MKKKMVGMQLRSLNNLIMRYMKNSPDKKKAAQITGMNGWLIGYLAEHQDEDIYQKDFEERFSITRSTASKVLSLDARLKKIVLTPKALEVHEMFKKDGYRMENILTHGFTDKEITQLISYIERMKKNMEQVL